MTLLQAAACLTLWRSGRFDTVDIAKVIGVSEADVCRALDAIRQWERGPDLHLVVSEASA